MSGAPAERTMLSLEQVLQATGGIHVLGTGEFCFTSVQTDSRLVQAGTLFVPLIGQVQDGHAYVPQALEQGASAVFVRQENYEREPALFTELSQRFPGVFFIVVPDTLRALQDAAAAYVERFPRLVRIGVTGSSGKTTTKEILAAILSQKYRVICNEGNLNSETGLPLSVFRIRDGHEAGIFEMGMNRPGEMGEIAAVLKPRFAVVTNIGTAHIGNLGSQEGIAREKARIFEHFHSFGTAVIPKDDAFASFLAEQVDGNVVLYGEGTDPGICLTEDRGLEGRCLTVDGVEARFALPGAHNWHDALGAIALARVLGCSAAQIAAGLSAVEPLFGRAQVLRGTYTVVQDCYNANPDSMRESVTMTASLGGAPTVLVLGDMLELGQAAAAEHQKVGALAASLLAAGSVRGVVFVGDEMAAAYDAARGTVPDGALCHVPGHDDGAMRDAARRVSEIAEPGCVILLKGSRGMALERLTPLLEDAR